MLGFGLGEAQTIKNITTDFSFCTPLLCLRTLRNIFWPFSPTIIKQGTIMAKGVKRKAPGGGQVKPLVNPFDQVANKRQKFQVMNKRTRGEVRNVAR